jgi:hypothetical protein
MQDNQNGNLNVNQESTPTANPLEQLRALISEAHRLHATSPGFSKDNLTTALELLDTLEQPGQADSAAVALPVASPTMPHTFGAFNTSFYVEHRRVPTGQEIFDAGMRAGRDLQWPGRSDTAGVQDAPQAGDFAKIVRGSNGQQVLFYKERDTEDGNILHHIVDHENYQSDMKISGIADSAFEGVLAKCDVVMADKVLAQSSGFL